MSILRAYYTTITVAASLQDSLSTYVSEDPDFWVSTYRDDTHILILINGDEDDHATVMTYDVIDSGVDNIRTDTQSGVDEFSIVAAVSAYPDMATSDFDAAIDIGDAITIIMRHLQPGCAALSYDNTPMPSGTFTDDFTGTDGDLLEDRTGWQGVDSGSYNAVIDSNMLKFESGGSYKSWLCEDQGDADQYIQFTDVYLTAEAYIYLAVRLTDADNYIAYHLSGTSSAGARLCKRVSGTLTDSIITTQGGAGYVWKIECEGSTVRFYRDTGSGFEQVGTDQTITDHQTITRAGIVGQSATTAGKYADWENGLVGSTVLPIIDTADLTSISTSVISSQEKGVATDPGQISDILSSTLLGSEIGKAIALGGKTEVNSLILPGLEKGITEAPGGMTNVLASILSGLDNGIVNDGASLISATVSPLTGMEKGIVADVAALVVVSATPLTGQSGNAVIDSAFLTQAVGSVLPAGEMSIANSPGAITQQSVTLLVSSDIGKAIESGVLVDAYGQPVAALEIGGAIDIAELTSVSATILTAITGSGEEISAIYGTPIIVPVLYGTPDLINRLQGTPEIK